MATLVNMSNTLMSTCSCALFRKYINVGLNLPELAENAAIS